MGSIRIDGDTRRLMNRLKQLSELDKKGLNQVIAQDIKTSTRNRFRTEKAPDNKKWEPSRRVLSKGGVTLVQSAILKNSIKYKADASGFSVGTNNIYAPTHQLGDKNRRITIKAKTPKGLLFKIGDQWIRKKQVTVKVDIPARPFLGFSEEDMAEFKATIEDYFMEE